MKVNSGDIKQSIKKNTCLKFLLNYAVKNDLSMRAC